VNALRETKSLGDKNITLLKLRNEGIKLNDSVSGARFVFGSRI
jgi:hypothetical protein